MGIARMCDRCLGVTRRELLKLTAAGVAVALAGCSADPAVSDLPDVYDDIEPRRLPIARGSLWAHLRKLVDDGRATTTGYDDLESGRWQALAPVTPADATTSRPA